MWFRVKLFSCLVVIVLLGTLLTGSVASLIAQDTIIATEIMRVGQGTAVSIDWSLDGTTLAVGGSDGIRLYTADLQLVTRFDESPEYARQILWSPDGTMIASSGQHVQIRDAQSGAMIRTLINSGAWDMAWSPDSETLAISRLIAGGHSVELWDVASGSRTLTLPITERVGNLTWDADSSRLAATLRLNEIIIWDTQSGAEVHRIMPFPQSIHTVAWSPDGTMLASGRATEPTLTIWDMTTYKLFAEHHLPSSYANTLAWSSDSNRLAVASADHVVRLLDVLTGEVQLMLDGHDAFIESIAWSRDANHIATLSRDHVIKTWDAQSGQSLATLTDHSNAVQEVTWRPNSDQLAVTHVESTDIQLMDTVTGELTTTLVSPSWVAVALGVTDLAWSYDGQLLVTAFEDDVIHIWDVDVANNEPVIISRPGRVPVLTWSPDNLRVASTWGFDDEREVLIWDVMTGELLNQFGSDPGRIDSAAWSPDGRHIVTRTWDYDVIVWDAVDFRIADHLPVEEDEDKAPITLPVWSPDSSRLAGIKCRLSVDGCAIWIWDMTDGSVTEIFEENDVSLRFSTLSWSPDGRLFTGTDEFNRSVSIWDGETFELLTTLDGFANSVRSLSWHSDSQRLAVSDGIIHIYRIDYQSS